MNKINPIQFHSFTDTLYHLHKCTQTDLFGISSQVIKHFRFTKQILHRATEDQHKGMYI